MDQKRKEFYDLKFEIGKSQSFHDYVWLVHRKIKDISPNAIFDDIRDRIENSVPYVIRNAILSCRPINEVELIKVGSRVERDLIIKARNIRKAFDTRAFDVDPVEDDEFFDGVNEMEGHGPDD